MCRGAHRRRARMCASVWAAGVAGGGGLAGSGRSAAALALRTARGSGALRRNTYAVKLRPLPAGWARTDCDYPPTKDSSAANEPQQRGMQRGVRLYNASICSHACSSCGQLHFAVTLRV